MKVANPIGDGPKRVPVSQHSAQSRLLTSGAPAQRVLCPANFARRVPVQSQKPVLSTQKLSNNQTTQQLRPKLPQQAPVRPQAASKSSEKPPQAAGPGNSEDDLHVFAAVTLRILPKAAAELGTVLEGSSWLCPQTEEQHMVHLGCHCTILVNLSLN